MANVRFEKFEMKYGYYLPEDFKAFIKKYGGDAQFGSCRFEYPENMINNILRVPGEMDFHLIPFGDVGNGDYYCFYKYSEQVDAYFIGLWLHETGNFVVLTSSFRAFLYKCVLDDYLTTILPNDEFSDAENALFSKECMERSEKLANEYGFDYEKVTTLKDEMDYHSFLADFDPGAIQSHCYVGNALAMKNDEKGIQILEKTRKIYPPYIAPYYLLGRTLPNIGQDGRSYLLEALCGSLVLTGYSYWEEDYLGIPEDVHREMELYVDSILDTEKDLLQSRLYFGEDPYSSDFRLELAREHVNHKDYQMAMVEYNNAVFCCSSGEAKRRILTEALETAIAAGFVFLVGILEQDIKKIR